MMMFDTINNRNHNVLHWGLLLSSFFEALPVSSHTIVGRGLNPAKEEICLLLGSIRRAFACLVFTLHAMLVGRVLTTVPTKSKLQKPQRQRQTKPMQDTPTR
jgi:hypothetical protein